MYAAGKYTLAVVPHRPGLGALIALMGAERANVAFGNRIAGILRLSGNAAAIPRIEIEPALLTLLNVVAHILPSCLPQERRVGNLFSTPPGFSAQVTEAESAVYRGSSLTKKS